MSEPPLSKPKTAVIAIPPDLDPDPPPGKSASSSGFLWSSLFEESVSSTSPSSSPSYLPDGTPVVLAPPSVILKASSTWAGHLLCRFLGEPPSPAKFYSDLNRIWGKHGDISVRRFSSGTFLVYVPSAGTRKWILQTGLWSSGTVSFVVSEWTVNPSLAAPSKLTSATTVLTIRQIPPQLWSHEAVARIAGGVAKIIPDVRASLPRSSLGTATIRAIVPLGSPLPPSVLVKDSNGDSVLVSIDYGKLPHLCPSCNCYGHQSHRCPKRNASVAPSAHHPSTPVDNSITKVSTLSSNVTEMLSTQAGTNSVPKRSNAHSDAEMDVDCSLIDTELLKVQLPPSLHQSPPVDMVADQVMKADNMVCDVLVSKFASDPLPLPVASPSSSDEPYQVLSSSPQVGSNSLLDPVEAGSLLPTPTESLAIIEPVTNPCKELGSNLITTPDPNLPTFSFPPPVTHALDPPPMPSSMIQPPLQDPQVLDQATELDVMACQELASKCVSDTLKVLDSSPPSNSDPSLIQQSLLEMSSKAKKMDNRDKRKNKLATHSSLSCKTESYKFKPKGIVEKRRKRAQDELLPEDEDLLPCIQEMKSDQKNTTHYEALHAHKILRKLDSTAKKPPET